MQDDPRPDEIVAAVAEFLRGEVLPVLEGGMAFRLRVAANALDLVLRALRASARGESEYQLRAFLDMDGPTEALGRDLVRRIDTGELDWKTPGLEALLWAMTDEKLAVDQPGYAGYRRAVALRDARDKGEGA